MNSNDRHHNRMMQRRRQLRFRLFLLLPVSAALIAGAVFLIVTLTPTNRRMSYEDYFGTRTDQEASIILQDEILTDQRALISETGALYLPHELVRDALNERFFRDEENAQVLFTTADQTFVIPVGTASYTIIDGALPEDSSSEASFDDIILLQGSDNTLYLNLDFLKQYTDIAYTYNEDSQHVFIRSQWGVTPCAQAQKEAAVRYMGGVKSPIVADLLKGDQVTVLEEGDHWLKVQTEDGLIGWVKANRMSEPEQIDLENEGFTPVTYPSITMDGKVALIWHMVTTQDDNKAFAGATQSISGINVVCPTWFSLVDNEGNVESLGSKTYVEEAHRKGLQVWGLLNDFSPDMDNSVMMASTAARRNCISQLIGYAAALGIDGINLDFEHVDPGDAYTYTQFVRELSIACRRSSLTLSVDTSPPYEFNAYLNRKELAAVCDYLILMGYDEHYDGSESTGSVASLGFQEGAIRNLLLTGVPADKLVSAVPLYARLWYTSKDEEGNTHISSEALTMNAVSSTLDSWGQTPQWDPVTAQNYAAWYTDEGVLCEIWIEDAQSLRRKLLLVSANDLAGTAFWALGFQNDSVWDVLQETLSIPQEEARDLAEQLQEEDTSEVQEQARSSAGENLSSEGGAAG